VVVPPVVVLTVQLVKPCHNSVNSICIAFSVLWYMDTRKDGKSDCSHYKTRVKWYITMYHAVLGCFFACVVACMALGVWNIGKHKKRL